MVCFTTSCSTDASVGIVAVAGLCGNGEARRNGQPQAGHFGKICALAPPKSNAWKRCLRETSIQTSPFFFPLTLKF